MLPYILGGTIGCAAASVAALRYMFPWLKYDLDFFLKVGGLLKLVTSLERNNKVTIDIFEDRVKEIPNKPFIIFEVRDLFT